MATSKHKPFCQGCGKDVTDTNDRVVRIEIGRFIHKHDPIPTWKPNKQEWGYMHLKCFLIAIGDPQSVQMLADAS